MLPLKVNNYHTESPSKGKRWLIAAFLIGAIIFHSKLSTAQLQTIADTNAKKNDRHGFAGAPYIKYGPETGWVGGLVGLYYFHLNSDPNERTRPSDISSGLSYSQLHQYSIGVNYDLYFPGDEYHLMGGVHYQRIPIDFFGIGDYSPRDAIDNYTPLRRGTEFTLTKNVIKAENQGEGLNVGVEGEFRNDEITASNPTGLIATNNVPGAQGGMSDGAGVLATYDTRDNKYSTHDGQYDDVEAQFYGRWLWSDYSFNRYTVDLRRFIPIASDQTLAAQFYGVLANGNEPFYLMAQLGGDSKLRGYYMGRFRDNDLALLQAEYRFPIVWRFSGVAFAGAGQVGHVLSDFRMDAWRPAFGAGLRFLVVPSEHLNARVDYGIGTDSKEVYFSILEAF